MGQTYSSELDKTTLSNDPIIESSKIKPKAQAGPDPGAQPKLDAKLGSERLPKAAQEPEQVPETESEPNPRHEPESVVVNPEKIFKDILDLSNSEIKSRVNEVKFDIKSIRDTSQTIPMNNEIFSWYHDPDVIEINRSEGTVQMNGGRKKRNHTDVAILLLKVSPKLKNIRFKMVPGKLSEAKFWNAIFYLIVSEGKVPPPRPPSMPPSYDDDNKSLTQLLLEKNNEILFLKKKIKQLESGTTIKCNNNLHKGKWILHNESHEFLSLDEELKQKLREGKKKRLSEVKEQMKFILDSDDIADSNGKWSCCGTPIYASKVCKTVP